MDEKIYQIAEQIVQLHQKAYEIYLPLVEDVCSRGVSEDELAHLFDYLLDFACDEKILGLYKRVCRRYLYIYPSCIKSYIEAYREMWEDEVERLWRRLLRKLSIQKVLILASILRILKMNLFH